MFNYSTSATTSINEISHLITIDDFTLKEVEEEGPVGACFMTAVVLAVGEAALHQAVVHAREEVGADAFVTEQFIDGRRL